ncbi:MAG: cation:proton antiporter [Bacteroidetes bacterium]|nr:cation:proton antiporter [Bacteroidota bacterium]
MHYPVLADIIIIFALSAVVLFAFHRLKIPPIIGFLFTGVIAGPGGLGAVTAIAEVEVLAEIGVILLMFTIGLEFSPRELMKMKKAVLGGGGLQVGLCVGGTLLLFLALGLPPAVGTFAGFLVALSSTAIVLKHLQSEAQTESPHGRATLGILIFQDVMIVPMMLLTPILAGTAEGSIGVELLLLLLKSVGAVALVLLAARYVIPSLMHQVAGTRNQELFFLFVIALCFLVAWLTSSIGLSLALGAFLAGMILADSEYALHALGNVLPFRDLFTSFFFVSVGMLLSPAYILAYPVTVLLLTAAVLLGKTVFTTGAVLLLRYPLRTALLTGLGLSQIGEFSFILSRVGVAEGLMNTEYYQLFLSVSVLTMAMTPVMMHIAPGLAELLGTGRRKEAGSAGGAAGAGGTGGAGLLIVGYGLNGRNLYHAAQSAGIPVSIVEMNPDTVRLERSHGVPIQFGDATQDGVLLHAGLREARVVVIAISDPAATGRITERVRHLRPNAHIITRTRFTSEVPRLYALGANEVIPEEFETAVEIFARTLRSLGIDEEEIRSQVARLRKDGYALLRGEQQ